MSGHACKVLVVDPDSDLLIRLQQLLEDAGFDTTITWDDVEGHQMAQNTPFDVLVVGDHPPEIVAERFLHNLSRVPRTCLLLAARECSAEYLRQLGIARTVPRRDPFRVLQAVHESCESSDTRAQTTIAA